VFLTLAKEIDVPVLQQPCYSQDCHIHDRSPNFPGKFLASKWKENGGKLFILTALVNAILSEAITLI